MNVLLLFLNICTYFHNVFYFHLKMSGIFSQSNFLPVTGTALLILLSKFSCIFSHKSSRLIWYYRIQIKNLIIIYYVSLVTYLILCILDSCDDFFGVRWVFARYAVICLIKINLQVSHLKIMASHFICA